MTYEATLAWMFAQLPMYQRQGKTAFKKDLTNSLAMSEHLNHPERNFRSIHVAGTNGKGSTSHLLASVLQEAGYKVGLYTSPHLKDFRERIRIDGKLIEKQGVVSFIEKHKTFLEEQGLSFFEMTVAMAFHWFSENNVDFAVVEVGLGGRLDSTNIIVPELAVITNIGYDHTQFLGETLPEIAFEKAGIIKEKIPVVIGEYQEEVYDVFARIAKQKEAPVYVASALENLTYKTDLPGHYQLKNVKTVVQSVTVLNELGCTIIGSAQLKRGLEKVVYNTGILGRWQVLGSNPGIICDTAHNKEGLSLVLQQLSEQEFDHLHVVIGVVNDKDLDTVLPLFPTAASYYYSKPNIPRGLDAVQLQTKALTYGLKGMVYETVKDAYLAALQAAGKDDLVFVGGSTFVVAEVL